MRRHRGLWAVAVLGWSLACAGGPSEPPVFLEDLDQLSAAAPEAAPEPPPEPYRPVAPDFALAIGDTWRWEVASRTGAGLRVLFMPTEPATSGVVETWELRVTGRASDGRYDATLTKRPVEGEVVEEAMRLWVHEGTLWMEGPSGPVPALEVEVPPRPVAPEQVPCVVHFLDDLAATCSPAPGGPLDVPPGPVFAVVSSDDNVGKTLLQLAVGLSTAGLIIPGNRSTTVTATLVAWEPARPATRSALVDGWVKSPRVADLAGRLTRTPPTLEEGAALVASTSPSDVIEVAKLVMRALPVPDRAPVARVALQTLDWDDDRLPALAAMVDDLGAQEDALAASVVARLPEEEQPVAEALLAGRYPTLRTVLVADEGDRLGALKGALGSGRLEPGEAELILARFDPPGDALDALVQASPPAERDALVLAALASCDFDDERLALLDHQPDALRDAAADPARAAALFQVFGFDDGKLALLSRLLTVSEPARRSSVLKVGVAGMSWDEGRLAALKAHPDVVAALSQPDRREILGSFTFDEDRAAAKVVLGL